MKIVMVCHKYTVSIHDPTFTPTGLLMVSAELKRAGHDVKFLNYNISDYDFEKEIQDMDVVAFSGFENFLPFIIRDSKIAKEMGKKTIMGGALATFSPDKMLEYVDTVVVGEADEILDRVLSETGKIQGTKPNLNGLPFPDLEGFGVEEYNRQHNHVFLNVLTSRGCPYNCGFCAHTCPFQMRQLDDVFAEIDHYTQKYNVEMISFNDNTLNLGKNRFLSLCDGMKDRKLKWGAAIRADCWDDEIARNAKESGFQYAVVGVESFIQSKLDTMKKQLRVEDILNCLDSLKQHDIPYHGNVLVGFPWETHQDIVDELVGVPKGYNVYPAMVQPFIGTQYRGRNITQEQFEQLDGMFREHAAAMDMAFWPGAEA